MKDDLFNLFHGLWQIVKAFIVFDGKLDTDEKCKKMHELEVAFTEPYRNTEYERLALRICLDFEDFMVGKR